MLVLSRRLEESIMLGDDIEVKVLSVHGEGARVVVRLGITSPRDRLILRKELYLEIQQENQAALESTVLPEGWHGGNEHKDPG